MSFICAGCIKEPFLSQLVANIADPRQPCEYCDSGQGSVDLEFIAERCDEVIRTFFEVSSQTMAVIHFGRTPSGACLPAILEKLTGMPEAAIEVVAEKLMSSWLYDEDAGSLYGDDDPWFIENTGLGDHLSHEWSDMESSLRSEARFVNPKAIRVLETVFGAIGSDRAIGGNPVLVEAGPDTSISTLYRARVFQTDAALVEALGHPERLLGAPREGIGEAGRMNAKGQPAFYGATARDTCINEVRPPVGSKVVVAAFTIIRPLRLLDLRRLGSLQLKEDSSYFDPATLGEAQRRDFLRVLSEQMVAPVMPELQDRDYLSTQVIADYFATHPRVAIDGILYLSAQCGGGDNVVLFHKASGVLRSEGEDNTAEVELWEYEDEARYFNPTIRFRNIADGKSRMGWVRSHVVPALELQRDSIEIREVAGVHYKTTERRVRVAE